MDKKCDQCGERMVYDIPLCHTCETIEKMEERHAADLDRAVADLTAENERLRGEVSDNAEFCHKRLLRAVADEREAIARALEERAAQKAQHRCPGYEACIYCAESEALDQAADYIVRARGKATEGGR